MVENRGSVRHDCSVLEMSVWLFEEKVMPQVMAHKHLQRRIEKWVRARGMPHDDEESMADSLKAAMQSSFDEPDLCARSLGGLEDHGAAPGSPGASTTAPSTVGASTIGPSSIHKMVRLLACML